MKEETKRNEGNERPDLPDGQKCRPSFTPNSLVTLNGSYAPSTSWAVTLLTVKATVPVFTGDAFTLQWRWYGATHTRRVTSYFALARTAHPPCGDKRMAVMPTIVK